MHRSVFGFGQIHLPILFFVSKYTGLFSYLRILLLIYEFFNIERKAKNNFLSKSIKTVSNNPSINKIFVKLADRGALY